MKVPNWTLSNDRTSVTVSLPTTPPMAFIWTASAIDEHFQKLGELRANMKPEIPPSWPPGQTFLAVPDPAWTSEPDALMGNSVLHIRDPRFGWLHYMIPKEEARKLAGYLQRQADSPPPGQSQDKPN